MMLVTVLMAQLWLWSSYINKEAETFAALELELHISDVLHNQHGDLIFVIAINVNFCKSIKYKCEKP